MKVRQKVVPLLSNNLLTCNMTMKCILAVILFFFTTSALASTHEDGEPALSIRKIRYHCASLAEGQQLIVANTDYYNSLTQMDKDWRMRKTGATKEELNKQRCADLEQRGMMTDAGRVVMPK